MSGLVAVVVAAALLCAAVALVTVRSWRTALRVLLDLLTAAGLLRLTDAQGWVDLAGAVAVVALRRLLWAALRPPRPGPGAGSGAGRAATATAHRG
ncbi:hypothetical protein O7606_05570 [Micromonospora sp. WMMD882]|uniref:hypothetical protein n=1 Tax=Micromonospora sp. WMMD882 TaxID=3015151 RepID=UPI00248CE0A4|nr:hypothetical protein [Micromonospora sp. WMMD882]WBB80854.1 hypothetical protein O7606_05570 [Micromonospora sp. WMMD882]